MSKKIKVLIVDDSGFVISAIKKKLQADPQIDVIDSARTGLAAIEKVKALRPDVVTMDVVMPEMDGLTALKYIMTDYPTPVVMLSALTRENSVTTVKALELGAVDFFLKPSAMKPGGNGLDDMTLIEKIKMAAKIKVRALRGSAASSLAIRKMEKSNARLPSSFKNIVVIGSSTGGPKALMEVVPVIPGDIQAAILIIQHMPATFTKSLAERLNMASQLEVNEARNGNILKRGQALLAPGGYHMTIGKTGRISLNQEPPVQGVRPSIDVTMKSVAKTYKDSSLGVILTGMGYDGTDGASYIKAAGGKIIAQDQSSSAIYGMPMSVVKAGYADKILPLRKIADEIVQTCKKN